jgi:hypothetical protein
MEGYINKNKWEHAFQKFVISKQGLVHFTCDKLRKRSKNKNYWVNKRKVEVVYNQESWNFKPKTTHHTTAQTGPWVGMWLVLICPGNSRVLWGLKTSVPMSKKIVLGSIQWPWNSPKTNSLHCNLTVVRILQNPVRFRVLHFSISLHYIQKQPTTINCTYTHISPNHSSLYPHQSNLSAAHY